MARTMKQGSTWPPLRMLLQDETGPVDLTGADSIELLAKNGTAATIQGAMAADAGQSTPPATPIEDHLTGRGWAAYDFAVGDTATDGIYQVLTNVTWAPGDVEYFPSTGSDTLTIEAI